MYEVMIMIIKMIELMESAIFGNYLLISQRRHGGHEVCFQAPSIPNNVGP